LQNVIIDLTVAYQCVDWPCLWVSWVITKTNSSCANDTTVLCIWSISDVGDIKCENNCFIKKSQWEHSELKFV